MSHAIYKYKLKLGHGHSAFDIDPAGTPLHVGIDMDGDICVWVRVRPGIPTVQRIFRIIPTGKEYDAEDVSYIGTVHQGPLVWHIHEVHVQ